MERIKVKANAIASLALWDCDDEDHLQKLLDSWQYRSLLSDEDAIEVVLLVAHMPRQMGPLRAVSV